MAGASPIPRKPQIGESIAMDNALNRIHRIIRISGPRMQGDFLIPYWIEIDDDGSMGPIPSYGISPNPDRSPNAPIWLIDSL